MATVWPSSLLTTASMSCTSTLRLPKSKQGVDYFINGNSYTQLKYGIIARRHHSLISRTPITLQFRVTTEGWSSSFRRRTSYCCSSRNEFVADDDVEDDKTLQVVPNGGPPLPEPKPQWPILERWNVPWSGTTTVAGMISWLLSFLLTGLAVSLVAARFGIVRHQVLDLDEQALYILIHQLAQTAAGLGSLYYLLGQYRPLPAELFSYDFRQPFDLRRGWLTYGGLGILGAGASVVLASTLVVQLSGHPPPREEADALAQLLPIIGASPASTASLIVVTGVLAPFLEETVFRGFFMTSLTKWVPTPVAIVVSACAFAAAHLTPGEFPQLAALGIVLGLAYAQTRTLSTPIFIHALWNSGVVILLTILRLQGYDIKELL